MTVVIGDRDPSFVRMTRLDDAVREGLVLLNALLRTRFPFGYLPVSRSIQSHWPRFVRHCYDGSPRENVTERMMGGR
jgi:hypothetical protein